MDGDPCCFGQRLAQAADLSLGLQLFVNPVRQFPHVERHMDRLVALYRLHTFFCQAGQDDGVAQLFQGGKVFRLVKPQLCHFLKHVPQP